MAEEEIKETENQGNGEDSIESLAEEMGWTRQEEWQGSDEEWVDAKTFIMNADHIQKQQSKDMKRMKNEMSSLTSRIEEMSINQSRSMKTAIDAAKERWEKERAEAIEESDPAKFQKADSKIKELDSQNTQTETQVDDLAKRIHEEAQTREWFKDDFLRTEAIIIGNSIASEGDGGKPWSDPVAFVDKVEKHMNRKYPEQTAKPSHKPSTLSMLRKCLRIGASWWLRFLKSKASFNSC
jgi:predicted RNase H-like nuclease (RuvC/YqgF family)